MTSNPKDRLHELLDHLSRTLDEGTEREVEELHRRALLYQEVPRLPVVMSYPLTDQDPFLPYPHREALGDPVRMLFNELVHAWGRSIVNRDSVKDDLPVTVRANFGTVLVASTFGARVEQREDNTPWVRHFESQEEFRRAVLHGPDVAGSRWVSRARDTMDFYRETLGGYPSLAGIVKITMPDLQGPLDVTELLRGSDLYLDVTLDQPLVADALAAAAEAQLELARFFQPLTSDIGDGFCHQHGVMIRGNILIRDDSVVMISPQMYRDQVSRHDGMVLAALGGGGIHSCGTFDHTIPELVRLPGLECIDFGQSPMNDMDAVYASVRHRHLPLLRLQPTEEELVTGSILSRFPTGVNLEFQARSRDHARQVMDAYRTATEG